MSRSLSNFSSEEIYEDDPIEVSSDDDESEESEAGEESEDGDGIPEEARGGQGEGRKSCTQSEG